MSGDPSTPGPSSPTPADERAYLHARLDELTGQTIKADAIISRAMRELRNRRQGFALLAELHRTITTDLPPSEIEDRLLRAIQKGLKMDRSAVLRRATDGRGFCVSAHAGFEHPPSAEPVLIDGLTTASTALATRAAAVTPFISALRERLAIPYFVAVPVVVAGAVEGLLVSGRTRELKPFFPPLDEQDEHTFRSLAGFLGSALANARLFEHQKNLTESFARFVPRQFLEFLGRAGIAEVELGDQTQRTMSILFSDIRAFTTLSERMSPKENFDFINRYLDIVGPAITENGGFIDKYIGDAIMALFPGSPSSAVRGAVGLHTRLRRFNAEWARAGHAPIAIGAGLHTGSLMLGTVGFRERMDTTVIADAVNLAARMEGLTKAYGAGVLITGDTLAACHDQPPFLHRLVDRVRVKGKSTPVEIIEVFEADDEPARAEKARHGPAFTLAFTAYSLGDFRAAAAGLEGILAAFPGDTAARLLLGRCRRFLAEGVPTGWDGVVAMEK
ncbi:MAG: adenylate/guanylate cyclase domain-containing protein [Phycisphaerales bacterium]